MSNLNQKYLNLLKLIVNECNRAKTKVIAYDRDSFSDIKGKTIKLSIPLETITEMEADIAELEVEDDTKI